MFLQFEQLSIQSLTEYKSTCVYQFLITLFCAACSNMHIRSCIYSRAILVILVPIIDGGSFAPSLPSRQVWTTEPLRHLLCAIRLCTPFIYGQDFVHNSGPDNFLSDISQLN